MRNLPSPCTTSRRVPSGCWSALWMTAAVPLGSHGTPSLSPRFGLELEQIDRGELAGGGPDQRLAGLAPRRAGRGAAVLTEVRDQVLDLLLHIDHPSPHL